MEEMPCHALLINLAIFAGYVILSVIGLQSWIEGVFPDLFHNPLAFDLLAFATVILPFLSYFTIMEQSSGRGTIGKRLMKIRVETMEGIKLSFARSLARSSVKFLP